MVEKTIISKTINTLLDGKRILFYKCSDTKATRRGEGAIVLGVEPTDDLDEAVPKRHLQDKGYDNDGNHLGYISGIEYPDGTSIDYVGGTLTIDGTTYQMGFDENYKTNRNGDLELVSKNTPNGMFKYQWSEMDNKSRKDLVDYSTLMKRSSLANTMETLSRRGQLNNQKIIDDNSGKPLGRLLSNRGRMNELINNSEVRGVGNLVVGEQTRSVNGIYKKTTSKENFTSTSVGKLNDKTLMVHNQQTGESRSVDGKNYNWDNTWKTYTVIPDGSGTHALYLGYAQNVKNGAWDNSGNPHNELTFAGGQSFEKLLVDKANKIVIQVPV